VSRWEPDTELGSGFVQMTLHFEPDYDGPVTATLIRNDPFIDDATGTVLYLHGFIDYFFQRHVAIEFTRRKYNYYALDLRKYGRSLSTIHPNFCKEIAEYFPEISAAFEIIENEGSQAVILMAHSTGALAALLYAKEGRYHDRVSRIILNSPFLDFKEPAMQTRLAAWIGGFLPFAKKTDPVNRWYGRSLHVSCKGEWTFNTTLKPLDGFVAYYGWVRAVVRAHDRIRAGLGVAQPILVLHSDKSLDGSKWTDEFHRADLVLDVEDIKSRSPRLGARVECREVPGAKHDVLLSQPDVLPKAFGAIFDWLR
jgi:alpha-beta hydrolase superfamily lysophospholipase